MPSVAAPGPLKADAWMQALAKHDVTIEGQDGTSIVLRPHEPLVLVRCALHGVWPDQGVLTPAQARRLAAELVRLADAIEPDGEAAPRKAKPADVERVKGQRKHANLEARSLADVRGVDESDRIPAADIAHLAAGGIHTVGDLLASLTANLPALASVSEDGRLVVCIALNRVGHPLHAEAVAWRADWWRGAGRTPEGSVTTTIEVEECPSIPPATPGCIAGALADGESEEGLSLNGSQPAVDALLSLSLPRRVV
jgi:hypothetical protein